MSSEDNGPTLSQLRRLMKARTEHAELDQRTKAAKRTLDLATEEVYEALTAAGIKGEIKRELGEPYGTQGFAAGKTDYARVYDEYAFEEWVKANGYEADLLGERKPRKKALNQLLRRVMTTGGKLPEGVEPTKTTRVTVRNKND